MEKIRRIGEFDKLVKELESLKQENAQLLSTIASLKKELATKQTQLPVLRLKARAMLADQAVVQLEYGDKKTLSARVGSQVMLPLTNGETTEMKVVQITPELVELEFPELQRKIVLHD